MSTSSVSPSRSRLSTAFLALVLLAATAGAGQAQTVVNDALDSAPSQCTTSPDASTINGGIAAAPAGGTVFVCPGTYAETVVVDKSVTLEGNSAGVAGNGSRNAESTVDAGASAVSDVAFTIQADDVTIDGFRMIGRQGVLLDGSAASATSDWVGAAVQNNLIETDFGGIIIRNLTTTSTRSFTIQDNQVAIQQQNFLDPSNSDTEAGTDVGAVGQGGEHTVAIEMSTIDGTAVPTISSNVITDDGDDDQFGVGDPNPSGRDDGALYGYVLRGAKVSDGPVPISGGTISGTMQAIAVLDGQIPDESDFFIDGTTMNAFAGVANNSSVNFHAGVFVFTGGSSGTVITTTGTIDGVTVEGTDVPDTANDPGGAQPSAGLYFGGFSDQFSDGTVRQDVTVTQATVRENANRGVFARGLYATATLERSTIESNGADPFGGSNPGFGAITRRGASLTIQNSFITNPPTQTSFSVDALQSQQATGSGSDSPGTDPVLTVSNSRLDRNDNGQFMTGSGVVDASGSAFADGTVVTSASTIASFNANAQNDYSPFLGTATDSDGATAGFQGDASTLNLDSESFDAQASTKLEEAIALGGGTALRLQDGVDPGTGQYSVPSGGVTMPGDLAVVNDADAIDFTTGGGTVTLIDENSSRSELVVAPGASVVDSPTFNVVNHFNGTAGTGNDTDWRILASPRANTTGADLNDDLDFSTSEGSILYTWDGASQSFVQEDNTTSSALPSGRGFFLYFFDDTQDSVEPSSPLDVDVEGPLDTGSSFPTNSSFGTASRDVTLAAGGSSACHMLGVPYAQSFDLSNLTLAGSPIGSSGEFDGVVQAWDPTAGTDGEFVQITEASDDSDQIAPWQGFWVTRASSTSGNQETLTFESVGRSTGAPFIGRKSASQTKTGRLAVTLDLQDSPGGTTLSDSRTTLYLREGASTGEDAYDAVRIAPPADDYAQVSFTGADDVRRAQISLPYDLGDRVEIPLHVEAANLSGSAVLSTADWTNVPGDWSVFLTDTENGTSLALDPGRTYRFDLDGTTTNATDRTVKTSGSSTPSLGGPQTGTVSSRFIVTVSPDGVLPVELARIEARGDGRDAVLTWVTASETNNAGFRIQHETDTGFETVGFVKGAGTSTESRRYQHRVSNLSYGRHVFRLVEVDHDGRTAVTKDVPVEIQLDGAYDVSEVSPNPMSGTGQLAVTVRKAQPVTAELYDALGRRVATLHDEKIDGGQTQSISVPAGELASGHYFVRVAGDSFQATRRLVVVR